MKEKVILERVWVVVLNAQAAYQLPMAMVLFYCNVFEVVATIFSGWLDQ